VLVLELSYRHRAAICGQLALEDEEGRWTVLLRIQRREGVEHRMALDRTSDATGGILGLSPAIYNQQTLEVRMAVKQLAKVSAEIRRNRMLWSGNEGGSIAPAI
jgi:hypothetical protein